MSKLLGVAFLAALASCNADDNVIDGGATDEAAVGCGAGNGQCPPAPDLLPLIPRDLALGGSPPDQSQATSPDLAASQPADGGDDGAMPALDGGAADLRMMANADLAAAGFTTVFTMVFENHDYKEIVGSPNAPFFNQLIAQGGLATNYKDSGTHPSLPNYLYMVSGQNFYNGLGLIDLDPSGNGISNCWVPFVSCFPADQDNLGHQLVAAGVKWRSYQESAGGTCVLAANNNGYAPKHDPFVYFTDIQTVPKVCNETQVDLTAFDADLAGGAHQYMWITPNLTSDGHDPQNDPVAALKASDAWAKTWVTKIVNSPVYQAGGVLFITWDEAEGRNGDDKDQVPMIILSPRLKKAGYTSNVAYSHANFLATVEDIFHLPRLGAAAGKPNMMEFFQ